MKLRVWLAELAARFEAASLEFGHGTNNPWDEAVALTLGALDWADDADLLDRDLSSEQMDRLESLGQRRIEERIPVPLLIGHAYFAGLKFHTAPSVMIPRSPIAELIQGEFKPWLKSAPRRVLDLCCGGGCIGIAIACQLPDSEIVLADIDDAAVSLSRKNVALHGLEKRVSVVQGSLFESLGADTQRFDLIVSNPPYVPSAVTAARPTEFQHEPSLAYDGGADGLKLVRELLAGASDLLTVDGLLVIEVGQWAAEVEEQWPQVPFVWPELANGGEGVLVLEAAVVAEHTAQPGW